MSQPRKTLRLLLLPRSSHDVLQFGAKKVNSAIAAVEK